MFTISRRITVNKDAMRDYKKEFRYRLLASGVRDEAFIEQFYEGEEIERNLKSEDAVSDARYEEELAHLVEEAVKRYELYWLHRPGRVQEGDIPPKKRPGQRKPKDIAVAEERQDTLGRYLARVVSEYDTIKSFRKNFLSGRLLSEDEALTFLSSPLATAKSHVVFKMLGTDPLKQILDTNYQVKEDQDDSGPYRKLVWGSGRSSTVRPLGIVATKVVFPGDVVTHDILPGLRLRRDRAVILPHPCEEGQFVVAQPGSIIGDAVRLAQVSLDGFPISREKGVWFILTGEFKPESPVRIQYVTIQTPYLLKRTTITLEIESWLPPEEVLEQYRHAQHQILGRTPRSLKRRTVDLFEFVNQHKGKTWRELFDAWNETHPSQRFRDRSHLYTTYKRARDTIASPPTLSDISL
jgi:hypothetical protein